MSQLLSRKPYSKRDDNLFLEEMNLLTHHHIEGSIEYRRIFPEWKEAERIEDLPFLHAGLFKNMELKTIRDGIRHQRVVYSSSTTSISSKIVLDQKSSKLQSESARKIIADFIGEEKRPLLILDSVKSLYSHGELSARIAAAMSLVPLATEIYFLLEDPKELESIKYGLLSKILHENDDFIVYGFSWVLWLAWCANKFPKDIANVIKGKKITFVHSGGWKKLEAIKVDRDKFNYSLLQDLDTSSKVVDYYGLVEQLGIIYPLCEHGARHVPVWADIIVRDIYTLKPLSSELGQLQLLNTIAYGAPHHSVLTEDIGCLLSGKCPCGRLGKRFELKGRLHQVELRGCANV